MKSKIKAFLADETGAETVEWIMVVAILTGILLATLGSSGSLTSAINSAISTVAGALTGA